MKKLLGLLAVGPLALAACGGSEPEKDIDKDVDKEVEFDTVTNKEATSYAAVSGDYIVEGVQKFDKHTQLTQSMEDLSNIMVSQSQPAITTCEEFKVLDTSVLYGMLNGWLGANGYTYKDYTDISTLGLVDDDLYEPDNEDYKYGPCILGVQLDFTVETTDDTFVHANIGKVKVGINADEEITELSFDETQSVLDNGSGVANSKSEMHLVSEKYVSADVDSFGYESLTEEEATAFETAYTDHGYAVAWETASDTDGTSDWSKMVKVFEDELIGMTLTEAKAYAAKQSTDNYDYQYANLVVNGFEAAIASEELESAE